MIDLIKVGLHVQREAAHLESVWLNVSDLDGWHRAIGHPSKEDGKQRSSQPMWLDAVPMYVSSEVPEGRILKIYRDGYDGEKIGAAVPSEPRWRLFP